MPTRDSSPNSTTSAGLNGQSIRLSPSGQLLFAVATSVATMEASLGERLAEAFGKGGGHGLLALALDETTTALPVDVALHIGAILLPAT